MVEIFLKKSPIPQTSFLVGTFFDVFYSKTALAEAWFFSAYRLNKGTSEGPKGGGILVIPVSISFLHGQRGGRTSHNSPPHSPVPLALGQGGSVRCLTVQKFTFMQLNT